MEDNTSKQKTDIGTQQGTVPTGAQQETSLTGAQHETSFTGAQQGSMSTNKQPNAFTQRKNVIKQRMDIALFMASASQLKSVVSMKDNVQHFDFLFALIILSMTVQVLAGVSSVCEWKIGKFIDERTGDTSCYEAEDKEKNKEIVKRLRKRKSYFDMVGIVLVLLIIVVNVLVTAFGISVENNNN